MVWDDAIATVPPNLVERELQVNVLGAFYCMRAVLPVMQVQGAGNIINVTAAPATDHSHFSASKRALEVLSLGLANDVRDQGITVNCLAPVGWVDTPRSLVRDIKPADLTPPQSFIEAAILLAMQNTAGRSGRIETDAEVLQGQADAKLLGRFRSLNPPYWGRSLPR